MYMLADFLENNMPGICRILYSIYNSIWHLLLKLFDFQPWSRLLEYLSVFLALLVLFAPVFAIVIVTWFIRKRVLMHLGKDSKTNFRRYQQSFVVNNPNLPDGITRNISMSPKSLSFCGDLHRGILKKIIIICTVIALFLFMARTLIYGFIELIDLLYLQFSNHRYTAQFFFKSVLSDIVIMLLPIIVPVVTYFLTTFVANAANMIYEKSALLLKTKTRITTIIRRVKKVYYDK